MKSPRKRRGACAAAHSPPRDAATGRFDTESAVLQRLERVRSTLGPWEGCGISGNNPPTDLHKDKPGHPKRVDIPGRSPVPDLQTETHKDLQSIGFGH